MINPIAIDGVGFSLATTYRSAVSVMEFLRLQAGDLPDSEADLSAAFVTWITRLGS